MSTKISYKVIEPLVDDYFNVAPVPYTITGLAYHCGITRSTLFNIMNNRHNYDTKLVELLQLCKTRIEAQLEFMLYDKNTRNVAGIIWSLKCNFNWDDGKEQVVNVNNTFEGISDDALEKLIQKNWNTKFVKELTDK